MKRVLICLLTLFSLISTGSFADTVLARKQLQEGIQKAAVSMGLSEQNALELKLKVTNLSDQQLQATIEELNGAGIHLGSIDAQVADQLAEWFKTYRQDGSSVGEQGHLTDRFGNDASGNGHADGVSNAMQDPYKGSTLGWLLDGDDPDKDEGKDEGEDEGKNKKPCQGYGCENWPPNCDNSGCSEDTEDPRDRSGTGSSPYDLESNKREVEAQLGRYGFRRKEANGSTTIDPKTGEVKPNQSVITKMDMYGNPIRTETQGPITDADRKNIDLKVSKDDVK
jgi:hypothetical protein